jgi:hypothetical protein
MCDARGPSGPFLRLVGLEGRLVGFGSSGGDPRGQGLTGAGADGRGSAGAGSTGANPGGPGTAGDAQGQ